MAITVSILKKALVGLPDDFPVYISDEFSTEELNAVLIEEDAVILEVWDAEDEEEGEDEEDDCDCEKCSFEREALSKHGA